MRSTCLSNELSNPIQINLAVIGLSGASQVKGVSGIGKSSICNRLVRPEQCNKQISTLTTVDFYSDIINGSHWIYWDYVVKTIDSKSYAFHVIEQTILINEQTYAPFENYTESEYISRAISGKISGSKRAYICPSQFSKSQDYEASLISDETIIDAFLLVYDVSEVISRDYQAQDRYITEILNGLCKTKKPLIIATSKTDVASSKVRSRLDIILEKRNFKSIPLVETSAKLNINISSILTAIGSVLNSKEKTSFNSIKQFPIKFQPYDAAALKQKEIVEQHFDLLKQLVWCSTNKNYDLLWSDFCADNDLASILTVIDRTQLRQRFETFKLAAVADINDRITDMFVVLFKKSIFEFVDPIFTEYQGDRAKVIKELLNNPQFLMRFNDVDVPYDEFMKKTHLTAQVDYPLPRFFITTTSPHNKLSIIDDCIEELQNQKRTSDFSIAFLAKLEADSDLYLDMSFHDVEKKFKEDEEWNKFSVSAKSTFEEFLENAINNFKRAFNEKLFELSFMIYSIEPMRTTVQRETKKKTLPRDDSFDMGLIESINNKIYFDNDSFNKAVFNKNRIKWIVQYMGSIISNQCYLFDFIPDACCGHLSQYLNPISNYNDNLVAVISGDNLADDFWRDAMITSVDLNTISSDNTCPSPIEFIPSTHVELSMFWENRFSVFQKVVFLSSEDSMDILQKLNRLLNERIVNNVQLSVISLTSTALPNNQFMNEIKRRDIDYITIGRNLCPGQLLKKLINEQANSFLFNTEPTIVWMVFLCEDTFDTNIPLSSFLSIFKEYIITERNIINGLLSISLFYIPSNKALPHKLSISIVSYHQAIKWLTEDNQLTNPHLLIYFCNLFRLASINTMFAVMQNLYGLVSVKSIMCVVIPNACDQDCLDAKERKAMVKRLASDSNVDCVLIKDNNKLDDSYAQKMLAHIHDCRLVASNKIENMNLCCFNNAFENDDTLRYSRSKRYDENSKFIQSKESAKYRADGTKKNTPDQRPYFNSSCMIMSRSYSGQSSDELDKISKSIFCDFMDFDYSLPLGCHNEELFRPITEESSFDEVQEMENKDTLVYIKCNNMEHPKENTEQRRPLTSKFRSYSGPVQTNKSFSKKYTSTQSQGNRSQRFNKKSQSLTTSPLASGTKSFLICDNCKIQKLYCLCTNSTQLDNSQCPTTPSTKSFKNIFSRFFLSERTYNTKSAEEKHGPSRRSFKFTKRNSERKGKLIPSKSGSDPQPTSTGFDSICLPIPHSISHSFLDNRKKSKAIFPPKIV